MKLDAIGFYTLSDNRCEELSAESPLYRCEMLVNSRCNFRCVYCRGLKREIRGDMPLETAFRVLDWWSRQDLRYIRFSGGEPTLYPGLLTLVAQAAKTCDRVAISTNGSLPFGDYQRLVNTGVNDFSISLDACCASECKKMSGVSSEVLFDRLVSNIQKLSRITYVTVGIVLTDSNYLQMQQTVELAHDLGVADIRIIPAAQNGNMVRGVGLLRSDILEVHPILAYRVQNILEGRPTRSIQEYDSHRCFLPIDDSVVAREYHFPCVIYLREGGNPIGRIGPKMRAERIAWSKDHDSFADPICRVNCLDVCVDHNNCCARRFGYPHDPFRPEVISAKTT